MNPSIVIGTAGHIDHGKSALVEALTGVDPDRLAEEKARGITLELGFAHLTLPGGQQAGVVDVPGHERFVRTMVAGAGGVDLLILVVGLDESVMPQTREHLDVCSLLGLQRGVVVLTKADLAGGLDPGWEDLVRADVAEAVSGTFLENAAVLRVSARSGEGLERLRAELARLASEVTTRRDDGPLFLPIDRVFTLSGFGTVVTGTLRSGVVRAGDMVEILPRRTQPRRVRVRGVQVHDRPEEEARAGQRTALNLAGIETSALERGEVITQPEAPATTHLLDVSVQLLPFADRALKQHARLHVHLGTARAIAQVVLLEAPRLEAGGEQLAQLHLDRALSALPGQPFILRGSRVLSNRGRTVAGGRVIALATHRRRPSRPEHVPFLRRLGAPDLRQRTEALIHAAGPAGVLQTELLYQTGTGRGGLARTLEYLLSTGRVIVADPDPRRLAHQEVLAALEARARARIEAHHDEDETGLGLKLATLQAALPGPIPPRLFRRLIEILGDDDAIILEGDRVGLAHARAGSEQQQALEAQTLQILQRAALAPPGVKALAEQLRVPEDRLTALLSRLAGEKQLVRVRRDLYFDAAAIATLQAQLLTYLGEQKQITTAEFKKMTQTTRKHAIPLAEHFDNVRVTLRRGEVRVRRGGRTAPGAAPSPGERP